MKTKIIRGCESSGTAHLPYLTRIALLETRWGNLYLHIFHRSDASETHHHPWHFISLILWRGYIEEVYNPHAEMLMEVSRKRVWPGMLLFRPATHRHRVERVKGRPAITLVWVSPRVNEWGFFTAKGWQHWKDFFKERGC